jgi:hypothetical protein
MFVQDLHRDIAPQRSPAILAHDEPRFCCTSDLIPSYFAPSVSMSEVVSALEEYCSLSGQPLTKLYVSACIYIYMCVCERQ